MTTPREALEAVVAYDDEIRRRAENDEVSFNPDGTAYTVGEDLDTLYLDMVRKTRDALATYPPQEKGGGSPEHRETPK